MAGMKAAIIQRIQAGQRTSEIARALGVSEPYVSIMRRRIANEALVVRLRDPSIVAAFYEEAERRGILPTTLAKSLIEIATVDNLFAALLD